MAELTGSEILAKCLKKEGVEDIFYIMGGPMLLAEATCITEGIRMIDVRHEQAAAFACQAYSRLKQVPSVCMAASGPGVTNLITGMAHALVDCAPVVAFGGSSPISQFGRQVFQEIDRQARSGLCRYARRHPVPEDRREPGGLELCWSSDHGQPAPRRSAPGQ
jgi:thiamine pyrophosphate-dependent acetolactate synthase large subunit-like protein